MVFFYGVVVCFKQKAAYEMRISDWSSDVCSSDLVDAQVGGKLAQLGARLIDGTARKMANDFFKNFAAVVENASGSASQESAPEAAGAAPTPAQVGRASCRDRVCQYV